jgi:hypothetical protein
MQVQRTLLSALVASLLAATAYGAPTVSQVSGTVAHNGTLSIAGSGFGSKSNAAPLVFDNFEAGAVGSKVMTAKAVVGQWEDGQGYDMPVYSNAQVWAGSKSVLLDAGPAYNLSVNQNGSFPVLYMDWRVRVEMKGGVPRNWKPWRLYGDNDQMQANAVLMCNGTGMSVQDSGSGGGFWWDSLKFGDRTWQHYQVILRASSSPGAADGVLMQYVDGKLVSNHTGIVTRTTSGHWEDIRIGHYWTPDGYAECGPNPGAHIYLDNVYIDTNWARVEIGNSSTYAASTHREIQIPTSWSDGSIKVTVNAGTFKSGTQAYLYIFDSNGGVNSNGYPITIGGTAIAPNPPTNVSAL